MTRRQFCAASAGAAAGVILGGTRPSFGETIQPAGFRLNYIVSATMYGTTPLADVLPEVRKTGAAAIDIWPLPHGDHREQIDAIGVDQAATLFETHQVRLGAITRYDLGPYRICEELPLLERLGGKLLVCGAARQEGDSEKERVQKFVERMKPHVAMAEERGATIGIENHGGTILNTPSAVRYFAEYATSPKLGIALAPYHLPQNPHAIAGLIEDLGNKLVFFQAWEHGLGCSEKLPKEQEMMQLPGRGELDFAPLLAALRKINYPGYTEIFMHPMPRGVPIRDTTDAVTAEIRRARDYLERCLAKLPA